MGFGQYATAEIRNRDKGYPEGTTELKVGRMTMDEIMRDLDSDDVLTTKKTAHNEVTRTMKDGTIICRLRETDIVTVHPNDFFEINTGGWNTLTTRRHIMNFLATQNFQIIVWGDKKAGGNRFSFTTTGDSKVGGIFREKVFMDRYGGILSDVKGKFGL